MVTTNLPSGLSSFGIPQIGDGIPAITGNVFWVDSGAGNAAAGNSGEFDYPISTIDAAIGKCTAANGDLILVKEGHAETLSTAGAIAIDISGVTILGLGVGDNRPTLTFSATAATIAQSANNTKFLNFILVPSINAVVSPLAVTGDGCEFDITIKDASTIVECVRGVLATGADRLNGKIKYLGQTGGSSCVNGVRLVNCSNVDLQVDMYGKASTAWVEFLTTASVDVAVNGYMYNSGTTNGSKNVIDTVTGSTWWATIEDGSAGAKYSGGSGSPLAADDVSTVASFVSVPSADSTSNASVADVVGNKADAGVQAVTTNKSLMGYLKGVLDIIAGTTGLTSYPAAAAAANSVSLAEVLRYVQDQVASKMLNRNASNYLSVTADLTSATWNTVAAHEIATITGAVHLIILPQITGTITSAGGTATLVLGDETTTNSIITSTDAENLAVGEWWFDSTDTRTLAAKSIFEKCDIVVGNGKDIGYTIGTEALTGGSIVFHMWWTPIDATGSVVAGAGGAL